MLQLLQNLHSIFYVSLVFMQAHHFSRAKTKINETIRYNPELVQICQEQQSVLIQFQHLKCNTKSHNENSRSKYTEAKDLLCSTSMMSHLVAYNLKILTSAKQMSTRFRAGNEASATFQPSGLLCRPYISDKNVSHDHSTSKEATDVLYQRAIVICVIINCTKDRTKQNKSKLNKTLKLW